MKQPLPGYFFPMLMGSAVLMGLVSIPLILRMVPRNPWYGVRTARSMRGTEQEWYAINRTGGIVLVVTAAVAAAGIGWFWLQR